tara:strand:- start:150 stop:668 length:519 start_codon:yes stop_codon:yes gene_type:complete
VSLICGSYWSARLGFEAPWPQCLGLSGYGLLALHSVASLLLFSPDHYAKFFTDGSTSSLNFVGELSMLFGVLALGCFSCAAISSLPGTKAAISKDDWLKWQKVGAVGLYLTLGHVVVMGANVDLNHWLDPTEWPRLAFIPLPSITLVASLVILSTLILRFQSISARKSRSSQ